MLRIVLILLCVFVVVVGLGIRFIHFEYRLVQYFRSWSTMSRTIAYFEERFGGLEELQLIIDTREEYGLVDPELFRRLQTATEKIAGLPEVTRSISFIEFVEWLHVNFGGEYTQESLGETLELMSFGETGLHIQSLIDAAYSKAKILIRFSAETGTERDSTRVLDGLIENIRLVVEEELPGMSYSVIGDPLLHVSRARYIVQGQRNGVLLFFPFLFVFLLLMFRSVKWAVISLIPTLFGVVFFLGATGWLNVPMSPDISVSLAVVLGVSVDDVIYFLVFFRKAIRNKQTRRAVQVTMRYAGLAIVQTTVVIVAGLGVLVFSTILTVAHSGVLAACTLSFCTIVTLLVTPSALTFVANPQRRTGGKGG